MTSNLDRFDAVWTWHRVATHALDLFETEVRDHPEKHLNALAAQSQQDVLSHVSVGRDELENFALLSLWALFEEAINDWLAQRTQWVGGVQDCDQTLRGGLLRRIQHWSIGEKIDAFKPLLGSEFVKNLHTIRTWRDWVAHRKKGPRPAAVDFATAQTLLEETVRQLQACSSKSAQALV